MRLMEALHREPGLRVALVIDDLWTAVPADNPVSRMIPADVEKRLRYAAMLSDSLVFTTAKLQEFLSFGHDDTYVIHNALPEWIWGSLRPPSCAPGEKLRIGWAGATQHGGDLAFLTEVVKATSDRADWVFLGMCPEPLRERVHNVQPMVPFSDYPATLNDLSLELAIAPLAVNDFNRCKSHLKLLEYGALGIPVVAVTDLMGQVITSEVEVADLSRVALISGGRLSVSEIEIPAGDFGALFDIETQFFHFTDHGHRVKADSFKELLEGLGFHTLFELS